MRKLHDDCKMKSSRARKTLEELKVLKTYFHAHAHTSTLLLFGYLDNILYIHYLMHFFNKQDIVRELELDSQRPHMEDNEYTRNIRSLENKLDKAMIKYNEAQSIRKTYEQIVRRLKEERVGFDNQVIIIIITIIIYY